MIRSTRIFLFLLLILIGVPIAQAQTGTGSLSITFINANAVETGEVTVTTLVSVLDGTGQPVNGLTADDFAVSENNLQVDNPSLTVSRADIPRNILLLIDTSGSMATPGSNGVRAIDAAKDAAIGLVERLDEDDQVAVYEFNSTVQKKQGFTFDHNLAIDQGIVQLDVREAEAACLNNALIQVINQSVSDQPRSIIVLTSGLTGGELCAGTPVEDVLDAANTVGSAAPIFTVAFGNNLDQEALTRLGQPSGGRTVLVEDSALLQESVLAISEQLRSQYQISYPTAAAPGLATIIVFENSTELSDRQQVLIPAAIEPTPTPIPQYSIGLIVNQPSGNTLEITIENPDQAELVFAELYVNEEVVAQLTEPPIDLFTLNVTELGSGEHFIQVITLDTNEIMAVAEIDLMLTIPPTPTPFPTAEPAAAAAVAPANGEVSETPSSLPALSIVLICIGLLLLLAVVGLIGYFLFSRSKQQKAPASATPIQSPPAPLPATLPTAPSPPDQLPDTHPTTGTPTAVPAPASGSMAFIEDTNPDAKTLLDTPSVVAPIGGSPAKLVAIVGQAIVSQPEFILQKSETKIGRNSARNPINDIAVQDKEVSRSHAKISFRNQKYFIQDLGSTSGTQINGINLTAGQERELQPEDEITVGPHVKFRFQFDSYPDDGQTLLDLNVDDLKARYGDGDPFRTEYD